MIARDYLIVFILLCSASCLHAAAAVSIAYRGEPLQVQLQVGSERRIALVSAPSVKVGVPQSLQNKLSVTTIGSQVWLLAKQGFDKEKIILKTPDAKMVLELSAAVGFDAGETILLSRAADISLSEARAINQDACDIGMVELVRYALQWAYAPRRLLDYSPCISAINYPKHLIDIMNCLRTNEPICGGGIVARPIAAWRTAEHHASLLELKNTLQTSVSLDPRAVVGDFKAAALAHHRLTAANTEKAVTALVVVGDKPLSQSIPTERWLDKTLADNSNSNRYPTREVRR